jgi:hypothetical protein
MSALESGRGSSQRLGYKAGLPCVQKEGIAMSNPRKIVEALSAMNVAMEAFQATVIGILKESGITDTKELREQMLMMQVGFISGICQSQGKSKPEAMQLISDVWDMNGQIEKLVNKLA